MCIISNTHAEVHDQHTPEHTPEQTEIYYNNT